MTPVRKVGCLPTSGHARAMYSRCDVMMQEDPAFTRRVSWKEMKCSRRRCPVSSKLSMIVMQGASVQPRAHKLTYSTTQGRSDDFEGRELWTGIGEVGAHLEMNTVSTRCW